MNVPKRMRALKERVGAEVEEFLAAHRPEDAVLLLDSTGPSITRQYVVLNAIGLERLRRFREVHAFSGAVYALFGYLALATGSARISIEQLVSAEAEDDFRRHHHPRRGSGLRALVRLCTGRPAFASPRPVIDTLEYIFGDFVNRPFDVFPERLRVYLALPGCNAPLALSNDESCAPPLRGLRGRPIKDIIAMAVNVPYVYGGAQPGFECSDAVYTRGYRDARRAITTHPGPTLVSTPWQSGSKGRIRFVNCYPNGNAKSQMLADVARLVLGFRNVTWSKDIYTAFRLESRRPDVTAGT